VEEREEEKSDKRKRNMKAWERRGEENDKREKRKKRTMFCVCVCL